MPRQEPTRYDRDQEPIVLSKGLIDRILNRPHASDLIGLYVFYYYTAKWQKTNQPKASTSYVANGLGWGTQKVAQRKRDLIEMELIESIRIVDTDTGRVRGHYIKVNFIWSSESDPVSDFPRGGDLPGVVKSHTNALSTNSLNALSIYTSKFFQKYISCTKWFLAHQYHNHPTLVSITEEKIQKGAATLDKLVRLNGFDFKDDIRPALKFVIKDSFWSKQVLSLVGLRHKSRSNGEMKFVNILASMDRSPVGIVLDKSGTRVAKVLTDILSQSTGLNNGDINSAKLNEAAFGICVFFNGLSDEAKDRTIYPSRVHSFVKQYGEFIGETYGDWKGLNETSISTSGKAWGRFLVHESERIGMKLVGRKS